MVWERRFMIPGETNNRLRQVNASTDSGSLASLVNQIS
jgi:hypothetical protein